MMLMDQPFAEPENPQDSRDTLHTAQSGRTRFQPSDTASWRMRLLNSGNLTDRDYQLITCAAELRLMRHSGPCAVWSLGRRRPCAVPRGCRAGAVTGARRAGRVPTMLVASAGDRLLPSLSESARLQRLIPQAAAPGAARRRPHRPA